MKIHPKLFYQIVQVTKRTYNVVEINMSNTGEYNARIFSSDDRLPEGRLESNFELKIVSKKPLDSRKAYQLMSWLIVREKSEKLGSTVKIPDDVMQNHIDY
mgnify:CR=1 FL=1